MQRYRPAYPRINMRAPLANGLVFAALGGGAGTNLCVDSSPYGNNGTLTNMEPTDWVWDATLQRWVLNFGGTGEYATVPANLPGGANPRTFAAWIYWPATSDYAVVLDYGTAAAGQRSLFLIHAAGGYAAYLGAPAGALLFEVNTRTCCTLVGISAGVWTHVAMMATTATVNASNQFFINGASTGWTTNTSIAINSTPATNGVIAGDAALTAFYPMGLSDLTCYNRLLSQAEIQQLADPSNVMLSGLILPPRRRLWAVGPRFRAAWLARQNKVIGGGTL